MVKGLALFDKLRATIRGVILFLTRQLTGACRRIDAISFIIRWQKENFKLTIIQIQTIHEYLKFNTEVCYEVVWTYCWGYCVVVMPDCGYLDFV